MVLREVHLTVSYLKIDLFGQFAYLQHFYKIFLSPRQYSFKQESRSKISSHHCEYSAKIIKLCIFFRCQLEYKQSHTQELTNLFFKIPYNGQISNDLS